jgi:phage terminase small subunit
LAKNTVHRNNLSIKQEKFCLEYFKCGNASKAALIAGYSKRSYYAIAAEMISFPKIQERIKQLRKKAEDDSVMNVLERKQKLTEIARAKLTDYMELGQDGSWVNIGSETPNGGAIQEIHSRTEYDKDGANPTIYTSVKLHDPVKAIETLNKMDGIYTERIDITSQGNELKPTVIFQVINIETQNNLTRIQNGERTEPLEINQCIPDEQRSLPQSEDEAGS